MTRHSSPAADPKPLRNKNPLQTNTLKITRGRVYRFGISVSSALACLMLLATATYGSPCDKLKAQPDAWIALKVDALVRSARISFESDNESRAYDRVRDSITNTIKQCKLYEDGDFINRYRPFFDYVETVSLDRQPDHELGFLVPDKQYFAETREYVQIPDFLLDQQFLRWVSRYETLGNAKAYLRKLNSARDPSEQLIFFSYRSRHLGTPDNDDSFGRLLIVVPGNMEKGLPDKWVQFGVPDPGARGRVRNVSVVTAVAAAGGTFNAYFKDFYRTYRRDGSIDIEGRWELGEGDDNCAQCHKSGVLPIFPVKGSVIPEEQIALLTVNARFRGYGSPRFGGYLEERKLGPGLGVASLEDRTRRFGARFNTTPASSAMVCSSCHNPERLAFLNWPMDKTIIRSYVTGGQMPMGHQLTTVDRRDLYAKLIQEYFAIDNDNPGILKSWLLGKPR